MGPHGLRIGWRLVIAISVWLVLSGLLPMAFIWIPGVRAMLTHISAPLIMTPAFLIFSDGIVASAALLTALLMTRLEHRSFAEYGLPKRSALGKRFWVGTLYGFGMISLLIGLIAALRGFSVSRINLPALAATRYAFLYFIGFLVVATFEEFAFRGYLQSTLQLAIGFWPAAILLGAAFAAIHLPNPGENIFGALTAGCFGIFAAFTLWRTGDIWFAMGMHTAWNWGETFVYSVRDSGVPAVGHLLNSEFHGPAWLTGGTVGPEGSLIVLGVLAISALVFAFLFPAHRPSE